MVPIILLLIILAIYCLGSASPALAFSSIKQQQRTVPSTLTLNKYNFNYNNFIQIQSTSRNKHNIQPITALNANNNEDDEDDSFNNDQREGMADAFASLDGLTADDFDDLRPLSSTAATDITSSSNVDMEESAKIFMEMQSELSTKGEEGVYDDILGDLSNPNINSSDGGEVTSLGQALDDAVVLNDADGLGTTADEQPLTTTADVTTDVLTQDIKPSMSMDEFMSSAIQEAVEAVSDIDEESSEVVSSSGEPVRTSDIAKTTEQLLEDEELRREIESIFDKAGDKLRLEVEAMKKEQEAFMQTASVRGDEYLESEKQRISEAEASVSRLINKVAKETDSVQKAMEDLELAKNEAGSGGGIENTALDLKQGGIVKQAALVGLLLFGSRAFTETILVVGSPYGNDHFMPAVLQGAIALACAGKSALVLLYEVISCVQLVIQLLYLNFLLCLIVFATHMH